MRGNIDKILLLLQAEGINPYNEASVIKSLSETVMPKQNIKTYTMWLKNRNVEEAKTW